MRRFRRLPDEARSPAANLAFDEALLRAAGEGLRTYSWEPPGLSLGFFQRAGTMPLAEVEAQGFQVVRRPTGGGAIAHIDEVTFALVDRHGAGVFSRDVEGDIRRLHEAFAEALRSCGVHATLRGEQALTSDVDADDWLCFAKSSALDLVADGRKLLGSAARRSGDWVLVHGSLPLGPNPVSRAATSVEEAAGRRIPRSEVITALERAFERAYGVVLEDGEAPAEAHRLEEELIATRYGVAAWTLRR